MDSSAEGDSGGGFMFSPQPAPAHVPEELVRTYPLAGHGRTTDALPRDLINDIHKTFPPVFWSTEWMQNGGGWVPRRFEDMQRVYNDNECFSPKGNGPFSALIGETWNLLPAESEPPLHALHRMTLNPMLAPSRIAPLEEKIRGYARERLLELKDRGEMDFVADFAFEFPIRVFLELMGLPQDRVADFLKWEHGILRQPTWETLLDSVRSAVNLLDAECEDRRRNPKNDLITLGVQAKIGDRPITNDELKGFCFNLLVGGLDTVSSNMASHFRYLAENPDKQAYLRANPDKIPDALEELLRAFAAPTTGRFCIKDTKIGDVDVKVGDFVLMATPLGCNDPDAFPDSEVIDFDRKPRHLAFGFGAHICIGMHLARRELRIAMEEALAILPEFTIKPGAQIKSFLGGIIAPTTLPIVWKV